MPEPSLYNPIGTPFIELLSVDSTNNYALTQVRAGLAQHGMAFFAHEQLAGKGQRGKTWSASRDSSLILSVVIDPAPLSLVQQFHLSATIAVAGWEFLHEYAGDEVRIKWPNDLYWRDRKAGGILIENSIGIKRQSLSDSGESGNSSAGDWQWAIVGIGINVNQENFPRELKNPVSLKLISGKTYNPVELAKQLCKRIDERFNELVTKGFEDIYKLYHTALFKKDQIVKLKKGSRTFDALIKTVSASGELVVEHGIEESFSFGEVEWIFPSANSKK